MLAPPDGAVDVVIDSDAGNEIDDQFAIAWALLRPDRLRLHGFTACPFGLSPELFASGAFLAELDRRRLTRRLDAAGLTVERIPRLDPARGVRRARDEITRVLEAAGETAAGRVHLGAERHLPDPETAVACEASEFLVETAAALQPRPLFVVAIGCLTNVASALLREPRLATQAVLVWTSAYPSFWPHANASYNLAQDLHAVRVVLDSGMPLVYLPGYYVGEELRTTGPEVEAHVAGRGPLGRFLHGLFAGHQAARGPAGSSKVLWDLAPLAWLLEPEWLVTHLVPTPRLGGDLRWETPLPGRHPMREALDVDRDAVFGDLFWCLAEHAAAHPMPASPTPASRATAGAAAGPAAGDPAAD